MLYRKYSPRQVCLLQVLVSSEFPPQLLPNMHLLWRDSVPGPHDTEQVHEPHKDQATKTLITKIKLKIHTYNNFL